jgi:hypothetical protein
MCKIGKIVFGRIGARSGKITLTLKPCFRRHGLSNGLRKELRCEDNGHNEADDNEVDQVSILRNCISAENVFGQKFPSPL